MQEWGRGMQGTYQKDVLEPWEQEMGSGGGVSGGPAWVAAGADPLRTRREGPGGWLCRWELRQDSGCEGGGGGRQGRRQVVAGVGEGRAARQGSETACPAALTAHVGLPQASRFRRDTCVLSLRCGDEASPTVKSIVYI